MQAQHAGGKSPEGTWSTGFCDCFSDSSNCCITCWCPCITFGKVAKVVDQGSTSSVTSGGLYTVISVFTGFACVYASFYRTKIREQYNIKGDKCSDCLAHCFCEACALTQEYRELEHRGFDMSKGGHANVERQNVGVAMGAPVVQSGMNR